MALTIRPMMGCSQPAHTIAPSGSGPLVWEWPDDTAMAGRAASSTSDVSPLFDSSESESGRLNEGSGENFAGLRVSCTAIVGVGSMAMLGMPAGSGSGENAMVGMTTSGISEAPDAGEP